MVKTCKQIDRELLEVRKELQQSKLSYLYFKNKIEESIYDENALEDSKENRNASRIKAGAN
jgi:hypothetical protein